MYAESNVTSCICHKLEIYTLTNPSVGDVIYQESRLHHPHMDGLIDYITHAWIGQCANSKLVPGSHVTLRIHLMFCTLTNPSVGDVIYQESRLHHPHLDGLIDYITHA